MGYARHPRLNAWEDPANGPCWHGNGPRIDYRIPSYGMIWVGAIVARIACNRLRHGTST